MYDIYPLSLFASKTGEQYYLAINKDSATSTSGISSGYYSSGAGISVTAYMPVADYMMFFAYVKSHTTKVTSVRRLVHQLSVVTEPIIKTADIISAVFMFKLRQLRITSQNISCIYPITIQVLRQLIILPEPAFQ